ncbi:MAG: EAL domain-containing protein, partial [Candidatus Omnitrophota bacterium]
YREVIAKVDKYLSEEGEYLAPDDIGACQALKERSRSILALIGESDALYRQHEYDRAHAKIEEAITINPQDADARALLDPIEKMQEAEAAYRRKDMERAVEIAEELIKTERKDAVPEEFAGRVGEYKKAEEMMGDAPSDASRILSSILKKFPGDPVADSLLKSVQVKLASISILRSEARDKLRDDKFEEAKRLFLEMIKKCKASKGPRKEVFSALRTIYDKGEYRTSLSMAEELLGLYPEDTLLVSIRKKSWASIVLSWLKPQLNILEVIIAALKHQKERIRRKYGGTRYYYSNIEFTADEIKVKGLKYKVHAREKGERVTNAAEIAFKGDSFRFVPAEGESQAVKDARETLRRAKRPGEKEKAKRLLEEAEAEAESVDYYEVTKVDGDAITFKFENLEQRERALAAIRKNGFIEKADDISLLRQRDALQKVVEEIEGFMQNKAKAYVAGSNILDILFGFDRRKVHDAGDPGLKLLDERVKGDSSQMEAILQGINIYNKATLIQGPPGTGKTTTIAEIVNYFVNNEKRVLVVSQANAAVNNVAERFKKKKVSYIRVGNREENISEPLKREWQKRGEALKKIKKAYLSGSRKGYVVLGTNNGYLNDKFVKNDPFLQEFDVVIVEEAGRATVAETVVPLMLAKSKVILVGDHKQLPAFGVKPEHIQIVRKEMEKYGFRMNGADPSDLNEIFSRVHLGDFRISLFERAFRLKEERGFPLDTHTLLVNRRSHPLIVGLVNIFYNGILKPRDHDLPEKERKEPDTLKLIDIPGRQEEVDTSFVNLDEVDIVLEELDRILNIKNGEGLYRYCPGDVTIISPYSAQNAEISLALKAKVIIDKIRTGTGKSVRIKEEEQKVLESCLKKGAAFDEPAGKFIRDFIKKPVPADLGRFLGFLKYKIPVKSKRTLRSADLDQIEIAVNTIDSIQGQENKVTINSMVRSDGIGFLGSHDGLQRINVSLSRAQEKLIIIGDFGSTLTRTDIRFARDVFTKIRDYVKAYGTYAKKGGAMTRAGPKKPTPPKKSYGKGRRGRGRSGKKGGRGRGGFTLPNIILAIVSTGLMAGFALSGAQAPGSLTMLALADPIVFAQVSSMTKIIIPYAMLGVFLAFEILRSLYDANKFLKLAKKHKWVDSLLHYLFGMSPRDKALAEVLLRNAPMPVHVIDLEGKIQHVNPKWEETMGYKESEVKGHYIWEYIIEEQQENAKERFEARLEIERIRSRILDNRMPEEEKFNLYQELNRREREMPKRRDKDGVVYEDRKYWHKNGREIIAQTDDTIDLDKDMVVTSFQEITKLRDAENRAETMSRQDYDTGLPNIRHLEAELNEHKIRYGISTADATVLMVSLDSFDDYKANEVEFAIAMYERLEECLAEIGEEGSYTLTYVDYGVFGIIIRGDEKEHSMQKTERAADIIPFKLKQIVSCGGRTFALHGTISMGAAVFPHDSEDPNTVIHYAEAALDHAKEQEIKEQGKRKLKFFDNELKEKESRWRDMVAKLQKALYDLDGNGFYVAYQTQANLKNDRIEKVELLARWSDPDLGKVRPDEFIPIAEQRGWVGVITEWVLRKACGQAHAWQKAGYSVRISVNITASDLQRQVPLLLDALKEILEATKEGPAETGLDPKLISLEITERMVVENKKQAVKAVKSLRELGVGIDIDDFGTGSSGLSLLGTLPSDIIKLDKSFMDNVGDHPDTDSEDEDHISNIVLVRAIINMIHEMGKKVVAEGVETREQLEMLRSFGCDYAQGFYKGNGLGQPVLSAKIEEALRKQKEADSSEGGGQESASQPSYLVQTLEGGKPDWLLRILLSPIVIPHEIGNLIQAAVTGRWDDLRFKFLDLFSGLKYEGRAPPCVGGTLSNIAIGAITLNYPSNPFLLILGIAHLIHAAIEIAFLIDKILPAGELASGSQTGGLALAGTGLKVPAMFKKGQPGKKPKKKTPPRIITADILIYLLENEAFEGNSRRPAEIGRNIKRGYSLSGVTAKLNFLARAGLIVRGYQRYRLPYWLGYLSPEDIEREFPELLQKSVSGISEEEFAAKVSELSKKVEQGIAKPHYKRIAPIIKDIFDPDSPTGGKVAPSKVSSFLMAAGFLMERFDEDLRYEIETFREAILKDYESLRSINEEIRKMEGGVRPEIYSSALRWHKALKKFYKDLAETGKRFNEILPGLSPLEEGIAGEAGSNFREISSGMIGCLTTLEGLVRNKLAMVGNPRVLAAFDLPRFPLTSEFIRSADFKKERVNDTGKTARFIEEMQRGLKEGNFGHERIGDVLIPKSLDRKESFVFSYGRIKITCFKVDRHYEADTGRPKNAAAEGYRSYLFSITDGKEAIGHGVVYRSGLYPGNINFRFAVNGGKYAEALQRGRDFRNKGYGKEALILIMAMSLRGRLFEGGKIKRFAVHFSDKEKYDLPFGLEIVKMQNFLKKAGFKPKEGDPLNELYFNMYDEHEDAIPIGGLIGTNFLMEMIRNAGSEEALQEIARKIHSEIKERTKQEYRGKVMHEFGQAIGDLGKESSELEEKCGKVAAFLMEAYGINILPKETVYDTDLSFDLPGATVEQKEYDVWDLPRYIFSVVQITINGKKYKVGKGHYLVITLANGKKVYWSGQHNLSYAFFFEHYREKARELIDKGGVTWRHVDAHTDYGRYHAVDRPERKTFSDWKDEVEFGIHKLNCFDYMGYLRATDMIKDFRFAYYPYELRILAPQLRLKGVKGGVTDVDIDFIVGDEMRLSAYEANRRFADMKDNILFLMKQGEVCFITNSSELERRSFAPLHIDPLLAARFSGELIKELAEDAAKEADSAETPAALKAHKKEEGIIEPVNLWEDPDIGPKLAKLAEDIRKKGLKGFVEIDIDEPGHKHLFAGSGMPLAVYRHKRTGLQIVRKRLHYGNSQAVKEYIEGNDPFNCPTFFIEKENDFVFELNLDPLGYMPISQTVIPRSGAVDKTLAPSMRRALSRVLKRDAAWFIHGHPHGKNVFVKLDSAGKLADIKITDWKRLTKTDKPDTGGLESKDFIEWARKNLTAINITKACMEGFDFRAADLAGADLSSTYVGGISFAWSDFRRAKLKGADLKNADLIGADFRGADLREADFSGAGLQCADFDGALMEDTKFDTRTKDNLTIAGMFNRKGYHVKIHKDGAGTRYCLVTSPEILEKRLTKKIKVEILGRTHDIDREAWDSISVPEPSMKDAREIFRLSLLIPHMPGAELYARETDVLEQMQKGSPMPDRSLVFFVHKNKDGMV